MRHFFADPHHCDLNIIHHAGRPYQSSQEMTQDLINRWNVKVTRKTDVVYLIGDFCKRATKDMIQWIFDRLNGQKVLVMGNHDMTHPSDFWRKIGFVGVHYQLDILLGGFSIRLRHAPYSLRLTPSDVDFVICGHIHNFRPAPPRHLCVSAELTDYAPLSETDMVDRLLSISAVSISAALHNCGKTVSLSRMELLTNGKHP